MTQINESCAKKRQQAVAARLKHKRKELGLSINELARKAGVAKSNLARMENGEGNPSLETVWALSDALGLNVSSLLEPAESGARVLSADNTADIEASDSHFGVNVLSTSPPGATRDIYRATLMPGSARQSEPHQTGTIEHVIVRSGRVSLGPVNSPEILEEGDYMSFRADEPHIYEALDRKAEIIIVMEYSGRAKD